MKKYVSVFSLLALFFLSGTQAVHSEPSSSSGPIAFKLPPIYNQPPRPLTKAEKEFARFFGTPFGDLRPYSERDLADRRLATVKDFLSAAFSPSIPYQDIRYFSPDFKQNKNSQENRSYREAYQKWLPFVSEYILRDNGFPEYDVLNKFSANQINVTCGWPDYKNQNFDWDSYPRNVVFCERLTPVILESIKRINDLGIVHLNWVDFKDENKFKIGIRVIGGMAGTPEKPKYSYDSAHSPRFEGLLLGMVEFTHQKPYKVEGYLLPNPDNTIGLAACYVQMNSNEPLMQSYVDECLIRSLGLPGFIPLGGAREKPAGVLTEREIPGEVTVLTETEEHLLRLLYDSPLKNGDTKSDVLKKLMAFQPN